jgi:hypothetical protein
VEKTRELKFRAWQNSLMWEPFSLDALKQGNPNYLFSKGSRGWASDTVFMQFTGCRDQNKREIYSGDIFRRGDSIGVIEDGADGWFISWHANPENWNAELYIHAEEGEVIGNIYENPDLVTA